MKTIAKNPDGSITVTQDNGTRKDENGIDVPQISRWEIQAHQIMAHARDPEFYAALPADLRAQVDAERAAAAGE